MIENRTVLWYTIGIKRWFSVQYRFGMAHQNTPKVIYGFRGILIIRRSGTACVARMGSVSPLGDTQAKLVTSSLVRRRAREFSRSEIPVSQVFGIFGQWLTKIRKASQSRCFFDFHELVMWIRPPQAARLT